MVFTVPAIYMNAHTELERILLKKPNARIIHVLSHDQRPGFHLVVDKDAGRHIDEFGMEVYQAKEVDWEGILTDIDERFESPLPF